MGEIKQPKRNEQRKNEVSLRKVSEGLQQLSPNAVRLLRELYSLIDNDSTGAVSRDELKTMIKSVGLTCDDAMIDEMLAETGEPVSFASFLAVMAEQIGKLPERDELEGMLDAFAKDGGALDIAEMSAALRAEGLSEDEVTQFVSGFSKRTAQGQVFDRKQFLDTLST